MYVAPDILYLEAGIVQCQMLWCGHIRRRLKICSVYCVRACVCVEAAWLSASNSTDNERKIGREIKSNEAENKQNKVKEANKQIKTGRSKLGTETTKRLNHAVYCFFRCACVFRFIHIHICWRAKQTNIALISPCNFNRGNYKPEPHNFSNRYIYFPTSLPSSLH